MSFAKSLKFDYLDTKEKNAVLLSESVEDDFQFKYVPVDEFKKVVREVIQSNEERKWNLFIQKQISESTLNETCTHLQQCSCENIKHDTKLLHREDDSFPEKNKYVRRYIAETSKQDILQDDDSTEIQAKDILLTIPEEENGVSFPDSSAGYRESYRIAKKPQQKSRYKTLRHLVHDPDCISSPDREKKSIVTCKEDNFNLRPDPIAVHKILSIQKKILDLLDEISRRIDNIPIPDGESDFLRRQQRVAEFAARFSRNYLYDLGRHMSEIRQHVGAISQTARTNSTRRDVSFRMHAIEQKLISAHQLLLNALNAYCKHIHSSVIRGQPGKLMQVLNLVAELRKICVGLNITPDYVASGDPEESLQEKEMEDLCSAILSKLCVSLETGSQRRSSVRNSLSAKRRSQKRVPNRSYYDFRGTKVDRSKKSGGSRLKEKKHGQMQKNLQFPKKTHPGPATCSSKELVRNSVMKMSVPMREDEIKTMMDTMASDTDESNTESPVRMKGTVAEKLIQSLYGKSKTVHQKDGNRGIVDDELKTAVTKITEEHLSTLMPAFTDFMTMLKKNEQVENKANGGSNLQEISRHKRTRNEAGNMQTIYLSESSSRSEEEAQSQGKTDESPKSHRVASETPLIVSDAARQSLLEYRNAFQNSLKSSPMYSNNTRNKPWDLMARIADKLVDELIVDVSKHLEISEEIDSMYDQEFREC